MPVRYFARRRVNPYRGVIQMVEAGDASARSLDGETWQLFTDDGYGRARLAGVWHARDGLRLGQAGAVAGLVAALEARPPGAFPFFDLWEHWLLERETGLPLALIGAARQFEPREAARDAQWHPFVLNYTGFHSAALAERDAVGGGTPHREALARMVNAHARPYAMTQWFRRDQGGTGEGEGGARLPHEWRGRRLAAADFPELLVRDEGSRAGNSRLEQSVIADYHAWLAPLLLLWPRLSDARRAALEQAACARPKWLARVYPLLSRKIDAERLTAAVVAARLLDAANISDEPWIEP